MHKKPQNWNYSVPILYQFLFLTPCHSLEFYFCRHANTKSTYHVTKMVFNKIGKNPVPGIPLIRLIQVTVLLDKCMYYPPPAHSRHVYRCLIMWLRFWRGVLLNLSHDSDRNMWLCSSPYPQESFWTQERKAFCTNHKREDWGRVNIKEVSRAPVGDRVFSCLGRGGIRAGGEEPSGGGDGVKNVGDWGSRMSTNGQ